MTTLNLRVAKGAPLTNAELDANFTGLDQEKIKLGGDIGGSTSVPTVISLRGYSVSSNSPTTGQTLVWNGFSWIPQTLSVGGGSVSSTVTSVVTSTVTNAYSNTVTSTTTTYPIFGAYANNTLQTFTSGVAQKVLFQIKEVDSANCYTTSNSRFTPTVAGYYQINAEIRFDGVMGPNNELLVAIYKNNVEHKRGYNSTGVSPNAGSSTWFAMQVSAMVYANGTGDYFEIFAQHGNTSNITITAINAPQITYWNGFYVPYQLITGVSGTASVSSTVTSTSVARTVLGGGGGGAVTVLNDISKFFTGADQIFTLKDDGTAIIEGTSYGDNKDFLVTIGGRVYEPIVPQPTLGPWILDYTAGRTYEYKVTGSKLILYREPSPATGANIRINNVSSARQVRKRYPFSPNTIVFGD